MVKKFVFWTGIYDLAVGIGFFFPGLARSLGVQQPASLFFSWSPALLTTFLGVVLILCSRNLPARGTVVYWEGILRIVGFFLLGWFGFIGGLGFAIGVMAIIDLAIGVTYLAGLPRALNMTHMDLLLDRRSATSS
jgi:hypothetical protein